MTTGHYHDPLGTYDYCDDSACPRRVGPVSALLAKQEAEHADTDGRLQPGMPGYWPIWGARAYDIRPGDLVMTKADDDDDDETGFGGYHEFIVGEPAPWGDLRDSCRARFVNTAEAGGFFSVGMLQPCQLWRQDTRNRLADSL